METPDEGRVLIVGNLWSVCVQFVSVVCASVDLGSSLPRRMRLFVRMGQAFLLGVGAVSLPRLCIDPFCLCVRALSVCAHVAT